MNSIIAIAILLFIMVAFAILFTMFASGLLTSFMIHSTIKAEVYDCRYAAKTLFFTVVNKGSEDFIITDVLINDKPSVIVWAWDKTSNGVSRR